MHGTCTSVGSLSGGAASRLPANHAWQHTSVTKYRGLQQRLGLSSFPSSIHRMRRGGIVARAHNLRLRLSRADAVLEASWCPSSMRRVVGPRQ